MRKKTLTGLVIASTVAIGMIVAVGLNMSNVSKASSKKTISTAKEKLSAVDVALVENQAEEKYIVNLVSSRTNQELNTSDWEICLKYLEKNYDRLMADETVDTQKVESYVTGYQIVRENKQEEEATGTNAVVEETGVNAAIANNTYDVSKVTEYIKEYWEDYNEDYPRYSNYGGDCANFVSQCLAAGGMQMVGTNYANFNNWFCRTSDTEQFSKVSSTWRGAEAFCNYWTKNCMEYKDFDRTYFTDKKAFNAVYRYANIGDAMTFFNSNERPYHTTIVNLKNRDGDREIRFAAHSSSQWERSLYYYINGSSMSKVRVYRMSTPDPELEASYDYDMKNVEVDVVDSLTTKDERKNSLFDYLFRNRGNRN